MDNPADTLDQADEDILTYTISDEALEAAAGQELIEIELAQQWWRGLLEHGGSRCITRVGVAFNPDNPVMPGWVRSIEAAGPKFGIQVSTRPVRNGEEIEQAIKASASETNAGLLVLLDFLTLAHRELIIGLAARHRLPTGYAPRVFATSGGLFSYGVDPVDLFRRGASYVDRILKGAKPTDLPVQQPTNYELVINLKTAKAVGLTVPLTLQASADDWRRRRASPRTAGTRLTRRSGCCAQATLWSPSGSTG
jgi:hypothetical protein